MSKIDMSLGEIKIQPEETVKKHVAGYLLNSWPGYTEKNGRKSLIEEIYKWDTEIRNEDKVLITNGATAAIDLLVNTFSNLKYIIPNPSFIHYRKILEKSSISHCEYDFLGDWDKTILDIESSIKAGAQAIIWNVPHNPTGLIPSQKIVKKVSDLINENKILCISDEVYREFCEYKFYNIKDYVNTNFISVYSFSKSFGISGARIGYVTSNHNIHQILSQRQWDANMSISWIGQLIARVCLLHSPTHPSTIFKLISRNLSIGTQMLSNNSIKYIRPNGGMFICIDVSELNMSIKNVINLFDEMYSIRLAPLHIRAPKKNNYIRLSAARVRQLIGKYPQSCDSLLLVCRDFCG